MDNFINTQYGWALAAKYGIQSNEYQTAKAKWLRGKRWRNVRFWPKVVCG